MESSSQWWPGCPGLNSTPGALRTNFPQDRLEQGWHLQPTADQERITCIWGHGPHQRQRGVGIMSPAIGRSKKRFGLAVGTTPCRSLQPGTGTKKVPKMFPKKTRQLATNPCLCFNDAPCGRRIGSCKRAQYPSRLSSTMESENHLVGNAGVFVRAARQAGQRSQPPSKVDRSVTPPGTTAAQSGTESELERRVQVSTPPLLDGTVGEARVSSRCCARLTLPCHAMPCHPPPPFWDATCEHQERRTDVGRQSIRCQSWPAMRWPGRLRPAAKYTHVTLR